METKQSSSGTVVLESQNQKLKQPGNMKAVRIYEFGGIEKLIYEDVSIPETGPDELLIRINSAGVNPVDWKIREGHMKSNVKLPLILGCDIAGTVMHAGSLVTTFKEGDRVFARKELFNNGGYAEYANVKAIAAAHISNMPMNAAAGVPLAAQTAWIGLFEVGTLKPGQKILIHGASGGVGSFAVQLAKLAGAFVAGTTSEKNIKLVKSLGADKVIDYKKDDFSREVNNFDFVFDTIGGETQARSWQIMHTGGMLVSTVGTDEKKGNEFGMIGKSFMANSSGARLQQIAGLINKGLVRVVIEKEFPLEEVKEAHALSQSGKAAGKIILRVNENK